MKLFIKLMIFLVILTVAGPYLLFGPSGMSKALAFSELLFSRMSFSLPGIPQSSLEDIKADSDQWIQWSNNIPALGPDQLTRDQLAQLEIQVQENIYYRWQDENGVWQFSQQPNRNTLNLVVRTDPNANVLQGLSAEEINIAFGRDTAAQNSNAITQNNPLAKGEELQNSLPLPTTVPVAEIPKLIEQAKEVQNILNQRVKNMDAAI